MAIRWLVYTTRHRKICESALKKIKKDSFRELCDFPFTKTPPKFSLEKKRRVKKCSVSKHWSMNVVFLTTGHNFLCHKDL